VAAWLVTIARNTAINMLPSHRPSPVDPEVLQGLGETAPSQDGEGQPSWLFATVNRSAARPEHFDVWLVTRDGRHLSLGETVLGGTHSTWGTQVPVNLTQVTQLRFEAASGQATMVAYFNAHSPWSSG